ncbi:MAG: hypothetical protein AAF713_17215 [Pseudomonadota bacterium]
MALRFNAVVLLERAWTPDIGSIAALIAQHYPVLGKPDWRMEGDEGVLVLDGAEVRIATVPAALLSSDLKPPMLMLGQPDANAIAERQKAHVVVSAEGEGEGQGPTWTKAYAAITTLVTTIVASEAPALLSIFWPHASVFWTLEQAQRAAEAILSGSTPLEQWIGFAIVTPSNIDRDDVGGMVTWGLRAFVGKEIELAPAPLPPAQVGRHVIGVCKLILDGGATFRDRETLRADAGGPVFVIRERDFWLRRGIPAYVLISEDAVVDPETLLPKSALAAKDEKEPEEKGASFLNRLLRRS